MTDETSTFYKFALMDEPQIRLLKTNDPKVAAQFMLLGWNTTDYKIPDSKLDLSASGIQSGNFSVDYLLDIFKTLKKQSIGSVKLIVENEKPLLILAGPDTRIYLAPRTKVD